MASVLTKFLIGIGWQTDDFKAGERNINTSLENIKTNVTTTGVTIAAAMIGMGKSAIDTAGKINTMSLSTNTLYTSTRDVNNFGLALRGVGGDAGDAVGEIKNAETALAKLRSRGEAGALFGGELSTAGIDIKPLMRVESGVEFMGELSKQLPNLTKEKKILVQETLGLSSATIELLSKGEAEYGKILRHVDNVAGLSTELLDNSRKLNEALNETQLRWDGIYNTMANAVMPILTDMTTKGGNWLIDVVKPAVEKNPVEMAVGGSLVATGAAGGVTGAGLSMLGMGAAGAGVAAAAIPTAVIGAGIMASPHIDELLQGNKIYDVVNSATVTALHGLTGFDISRDNVHKDEPTLWERLFTDDKTVDNKQPSTERVVENKKPSWWDSLSDKPEQPSTERVVENKKPSWWDSLSDKPEQPSFGDFEQPSWWDSVYDESIRNEQPPFNSSVYVPEQYAPTEFKAPPPQQVEVQLKSSDLPPVNHNLYVTLDGQAIESKIQKINERSAVNTIADLGSTTAR
jgi:hypothetical protein